MASIFRQAFGLQRSLLRIQCRTMGKDILNIDNSYKKFCKRFLSIWISLKTSYIIAWIFVTILMLESIIFLSFINFWIFLTTEIVKKSLILKHLDSRYTWNRILIYFDSSSSFSLTFFSRDLWKLLKFSRTPKG